MAGAGRCGIESRGVWILESGVRWKVPASAGGSGIGQRVWGLDVEEQRFQSRVRIAQGYASWGWCRMAGGSEEGSKSHVATLSEIGVEWEARANAGKSHGAQGFRGLGPVEGGSECGWKWCQATRVGA